mgnify:CR=1 FL=1
MSFIGKGRNSVKLTKRSVEALTPEAQEYFVWDNQIAGFGVRILPDTYGLCRLINRLPLPMMETSHEARVVSPETKVTEYTVDDETTTTSNGSRVIGLRAGAVSGRQLA